MLTALWAGCALVFPTHTHRFRLTIEVETPTGVRTGSSVIEVERGPNAPMRYAHRVRGEGVFLDLGEGHNIVAILAHGSNAEWTSELTSFWIEAYGRKRSEEDDVWTGRKKLRGVVELRSPLIPTLVTFADPLDPATVRVVPTSDFDEAFGPGYRFRRATLEVLPNGWWPANALGLSKGEPYTRGVIERHLPWLAGMKTNLAGTRGQSTNDLRERLNPFNFRRQDP